MRAGFLDLPTPITVSDEFPAARYLYVASSANNTVARDSAGNKITGTLVDPDGVSLPINGGTAGDRGREVVGLMYNSYTAIRIELKLTGDRSFSGYYWVSGSPIVPWTGNKQ